MISTHLTGLTLALAGGQALISNPGTVCINQGEGAILRVTLCMNSALIPILSIKWKSANIYRSPLNCIGIFVFVFAAQKLGLVEAPKGLLSDTEWKEVKEKSNARQDSSQPCVICKEDFGLQQQVRVHSPVGEGGWDWGTPQSFIWGGSTPRFKPLPFVYSFL